jgi:recombination protein RecA
LPSKKGQLTRAAKLANEINTTLDLVNPIMLGNDKYFEITRVPSGSLVIDRITGGGFAHGRHVELFGDESACKSYLAYMTMVLAQQRGKLCAIVDPEHSFDFVRFENLGGNPGELLAQHPNNAEEAVAVMMLLAKFAEDSDLEVITIDSIPSLVPREETEKDPREEARIAGQARMMSRALRLITVMNRKTVFLWINQERTNVGIKFGNPRTTSGGKALRFYASTRLELRRGAMVKSKRKIAKVGKLVESEVAVGRWISARAEKDKTTRPYREGSFIFDADSGIIDVGSEIIQLGLEDGLIKRSGNTYSYTDLDDNEWSGLEKRFKKLITENEEVKQELIDQIQDNTIRQAVGEEDNGDDQDD